MYQDFSSWAMPARRKDRGWPTDRTQRWSTRSGTSDPRPQATRGAPVVAHDVGPVQTELVEDGQDVAGQQHQGVVVDVRRLARGTISPQVGHDDLETGRGHRVDLVAPQPARVGEAVQQDDGATGPADLDVDVHTATVDLQGGHRVSPDGNCSPSGPARGAPVVSGQRAVTDFRRVLNRMPSMPWMCASPNKDCFHPPNE